MLDRTFLNDVKKLYERSGGWILTLTDETGSKKKWILENKKEGLAEIPEPLQQQICILKKETAISGIKEWNYEGERVFLEMAAKKDRIIICGAGYVGNALARLSGFVGIYTIVLEDREFFAQKAREAGADEVICKPFDEAIASLDDEKNSAYVIMTRGHAYDQKCLTEVAKKEAYYVGMMGSATRASMMKEELIHAGINKEWTENLHTPIGLKIGAQTPEEIAISVIAEILSERKKAGCGMKEGHEVFECACRKLKTGERFVLATILERKGSAPRREGTHFIVSESGETFGTIGGGKLEADVTEAAQDMLSKYLETRIIKADLNNRQASEEGLVCGGTVTVLLEMGINK